MPDVTVEAVNVVGSVIEVSNPATVVVEVATVVGPRGPAGAAGTVYVQSVPLATWTIPHTLGRRPIVAVYVDGELVEPDVITTSAAASVMFTAPTVGEAILV